MFTSKFEMPTQAINEVLKYIGLSKFEARTELFQEIASSNNTARIYFHQKINFNDIKSVDNFLKQVTDPIIEAVQNSDAVKAAKEELSDKVKELEIIVADQKDEIARLQEFEVYYKMTYEMSHGK